jgi:RHS repeat-associated protein
MRASSYYDGFEDLRGLGMGDVPASFNNYTHAKRNVGSLHKSPKIENQRNTTAGKTPGKSLESELISTYYIWSHDCKLMAEYDHNDNCVKDYIYIGNKLLAEYNPQTGKYYYHMSDQVNSTRIVTDDAGNVVYSAAHGPYGDIQKTWVNTYDPKQKFSGKERESYSDLDYFGARYYDNHSYRFISVDPIRNRDEALVNPQLWNLYSYCRNNTITFLDPNGLENYVLYDPNNFSKQAKVEGNRMTKSNKEHTTLLPVATEDQFNKSWNSMKDVTDVTLIFHSGDGGAAPTTVSIDWENRQYLTTNPKGKTPRGTAALYIGKLAKKSIKTLRLYICNSGKLSVNDNTAVTFLDTQNIYRVIAPDGPANFYWPSYKPKVSNNMIEYVKKAVNIKLVD